MERPFVHPSALIQEGAVVHPTAVIGPNVIIGPRVHVGAYTVIGTHAEHADVNVRRDTPGRVTIDFGTVIREHVTIHGASDPDGCTRIGTNSLIQAHAHIGHDAVLHQGVTVACFGCIGGHAVVGANANIGLHAVLHQFAEVAEGCMVGAGAFVKGKTQPYTTYVGVPAKPIGANWRLVRKLLSATSMV